MSKFSTVKDVPALDFIKGYAEYLKKTDKIKIPDWFAFIKSAPGRELAPLDPDWIYIRAAALARKIYLRGHLGVGKLMHIYGGKYRNGAVKAHHQMAGGKIIRYLLQQLEAIDVVKKDKKSEMKKNSRIITKIGQTDLNRIATEIANKK